MQCLEAQKTQVLLLKIPEAMRRYGFTDASSFRRFRRLLGIPSPDKAPFPVHHILKMDECWIATKLPALMMKQRQYKALVASTGQTLRQIVSGAYKQDIRDLIAQAPAEFQNHEITQTYLQRLAIEDKPHEYR